MRKEQNCLFTKEEKQYQTTLWSDWVNLYKFPVSVSYINDSDTIRRASEKPSNVLFFFFGARWICSSYSKWEIGRTFTIIGIISEALCSSHFFVFSCLLVSPFLSASLISYIYILLADYRMVIKHAFVRLWGWLSFPQMPQPPISHTHSLSPSLSLFLSREREREREECLPQPASSMSLNGIIGFSDYTAIQVYGFLTITFAVGWDLDFKLQCL